MGYTISDLEYAMTCQAMVSDLGELIMNMGDAIKKQDYDGLYQSIGEYIVEVKKLDEKFTAMKPSAVMRFHQKSFRELMDAHKRLSWLLYKTPTMNLPRHTKALNLAIDDIAKASEKVTVATKSPAM